MMNDFAGFALCAAVILFAGRKLSVYGDAIAEKTGLGKAWFGLIMMSAVTSLPEMVSCISAVAVVKQPDLAVGNVLGSCAFNLAIMSLMDVLVPRSKGSLLSQVSRTHILAATMGIILLSMVGWGLLLPHQPLLGWVGVVSLLFLGGYFLSVRLIYLQEQKALQVSGLPPQATMAEPHPQGEFASLTLQEAILRYIGFAGLVIAAALFLPGFADGMARSTGLGATFVGTLFLAFSTVLPEIAVSVSSIRRGSVDMAVGNLLGSNIFNIFVLALSDIFYTPDALLTQVSNAHISSVMAICMMTGVAIAGLMYRTTRKRFLMATDTLLIVLIYLVNLILLYQA